MKNLGAIFVNQNPHLTVGIGTNYRDQTLTGARLIVGTKNNGNGDWSRSCYRSETFSAQHLPGLDPLPVHGHVGWKTGGVRLWRKSGTWSSS